MRRMLVGLKRLASRQIGFRVAAAVIIPTVAIVSSLVVPMLVTVDGIFYIASAKSLFTSDFAELYVWYREPGYPFFLRVVHAFGDAGLLLIFVQSTLLGAAGFLAFYCVRRSLGQKTASVGQVAVMLLLLLNPMYLIYSGLVLQQALFAFQLSLFGLCLVWAFRRPTWLPRYWLVIAVIVLYFAAIWTSIGWLYLALLPVTTTILVVVFPVIWERLSPRLSKIAGAFRRLVVATVATVAAAAMLMVVYASGLQVYEGWVRFKAPYVANATSAVSVIEPLSGIPRIPTVPELTSRMLALMHIGTVESYQKENTLFLDQQMSRARAKSGWDTAFVAEPHTSFAPGYFTLTNPSPLLHEIYSVGAKVASPAYQATFLGFLLSIVIAAIRRRWILVTVLTLIPLGFLGVYAASNSPIDRYGIPTYTFAAAAVGVLLSWAFSGIGRVWARKKGVETSLDPSSRSAV